MFQVSVEFDFDGAVSSFTNGNSQILPSPNNNNQYTPPKTNMEPENGPLEKATPIGNHHFQFSGSTFNFGGVNHSQPLDERNPAPNVMYKAL